MKVFRNISVTLLAIALIGAEATDAWKQVRDGLAAFRDGDFAKADAAFEKADSLDSDDRPQQASRIRFNRGCAKAALDESDKALEFFRDAARDRASGLSADAHYNMGCLAADQAKAVFGDDPAAADVKTREDGLKHLQTAIVHYRDARRIDPQHENARHNLEVIRLWIKQMQAVWAERDRQKARDEKDLLQFLVHIEQQQLGIRQFVRILDQEKDSPRRRQAVMDVEARQRELAQEIRPLKAKIRTQFEQQAAASTAGTPGAPTGPGAAGSAPDPEMVKRIEQAVQQLSDVADQVGEAMVSSADHLESQLLPDSTAAQELALKRLLEFYLGIAPFPHVLDRSISEQQQMVSESPASLVNETDDQNTGETDSTNQNSENKTTDDAKAKTVQTDSIGSEPPYDYRDAGWRQSRVSEYAGAITFLAQGELETAANQLKAVEQQLADLPADEAATDPPTDPPDASTDDADNALEQNDTKAPAAEEAKAQTQDAPPTEREKLLQARQHTEQMMAAMQLATDYGPQIRKRTKSAAEWLLDENAGAALPDQTESLRMLEEIKDAMPKQAPEQNENQDQQNDDQQNKPDQPQEQNQQGNEDDKNKDEKNENKGDKNKKDEQQNEQQQQKQQPKPEQASREQVKSMLRKVRERERKHRELQDKLRRALMIPGKVERDW